MLLSQPGRLARGVTILQSDPAKEKRVRDESSRHQLGSEAPLLIHQRERRQECKDQRITEPGQQ